MTSRVSALTTSRPEPQFTLSRRPSRTPMWSLPGPPLITSRPAPPLMASLPPPPSSPSSPARRGPRPRRPARRRPRARGSCGWSSLRVRVPWMSPAGALVYVYARAAACLTRRDSLGPGLDDADDVALGVGELTDLEALHHLLRSHQPGAPEALGLGERRLDVRDLDVDRDVPVVAFRASGDAATDPHAVGIDVVLAGDDAVVHRVARVDLPAEQLRVVALELRSVLPDDLEVHDGLAHGRFPLRSFAKNLRPGRQAALRDFATWPSTTSAPIGSPPTSSTRSSRLSRGSA